MDINDIYRPLLTHFRTRRVVAFYRQMRVHSSTRVLDVGGSSFFWDLTAKLGLPTIREITVLNVYETDQTQLPSNVRWIKGDARRMPFKDGAFDIAFCNSVIEHVGDAAAQAECATEIRRVGKKYWVQTPDPRFFVEPHYLAPFVHWMPKDWRARFVRYGTIWGLVTKPSRIDVEDRIREIRLLSAKEFASMFPDAELTVERFAGWPKSLIATRR